MHGERQRGTQAGRLARHTRSEVPREGASAGLAHVGTHTTSTTKHWASAAAMTVTAPYFSWPAKGKSPRGSGNVGGGPEIY